MMQLLLNDAYAVLRAAAACIGLMGRCVAFGNSTCSRADTGNLALSRQFTSNERLPPLPPPPSHAHPQSPAVKRWHEDVSLYAVRDARPGSEGALVGWFYVDLHPRDGKYTHAAVFPLISGCEGAAAGAAAGASAAGTAGASAAGTAGAAGVNAGRVLPVAAMVCNFSKPSGETPSLLRHEEVVTLFHEFGHVMHHLLSRTRLHRWASFRCEMDFVEAPSQVRRRGAGGRAGVEGWQTREGRGGGRWERGSMHAGGRAGGEGRRAPDSCRRLGGRGLRCMLNRRGARH